MNQTKDKNGVLVQEGSWVKVLAINPSVIARLNSEDALYVDSMKGEVLEVYEVDESGSAWVKKWWELEDGATFCHSLALAPNDMEAMLEH